VLTYDEREDTRVTTKWITLSVVGVLALLAWATLGEAASIGPGAFVSPTTVTYDGLGLPFFNATPIVIAGDTYTTDDGRLRYFTSFGGCTGTNCIGNDTDGGFIDVVLGGSVQRLGAFFGVDDSTWAADVSFFNATDTLLGTVSISGNPGSFGFAGWEDVGGIGRMHAVDTLTDFRVIAMDNLMKEAGSRSVPLPSSLWLLGASIAVLLVGRSWLNTGAR